MPGIGERRGRGQPLQVGAGVELLDDDGQQLVLGRLLQECDEWFEVAEDERLRLVAGDGGAESEFEGEPGAEAGGDHAFADVGEEVAAGMSHEKLPERLGGGGVQRWVYCGRGWRWVQGRTGRGIPLEFRLQAVFGFPAGRIGNPDGRQAPSRAHFGGLSKDREQAAARGESEGVQPVE